MFMKILSNKYFYNINITVAETTENQGKLKKRKRRVDYSAQWKHNYQKRKLKKVKDPMIKFHISFSEP